MADALDDFASAAREYCSWCEEPTGDTPQVFRMLARLVALIVDVSADECGEMSARDISHEDWKQVLQKLQPMPFSYYNMTLDPHDIHATDQGLNDLFDDLADTWRDLKPGLELFDAGHRVEAAWHWRLHFDIHWGRHATSAMHATHNWLADHRYDP